MKTTASTCSSWIRPISGGEIILRDISDGEFRPAPGAPGLAGAYAGKPRIRRIGIVALARKLLVALWRYVTQGVVPEGAVFKAA